VEKLLSVLDLVSSNVDPKLFFSDLDPTLTLISISDPDPDSDPACL
jgi:hypothetical protein